MPKVSRAAATATFTKLMSALLTERQECAARLTEIDGLFARYGISLAEAGLKVGGPKAAAPTTGGVRAATVRAAKRKLHPNSNAYQARAAALAKARAARLAKLQAAKATASEAQAPAGNQRKRMSYSQTSDQFVLGLLENGKVMSTGQIDAAWKEAGRRGRPHNTLTALYQAKKIRRQDNKEGRGSVYSLG